MESALQTLRTHDVEGLNQAVEKRILTVPALYKEFLSFSVNDKLSDKTLALYASGPLEQDVILGEDKDPYSTGVYDRIGQESLSTEGIRWFYDLFRKDPDLFNRLRLIPSLKSVYPDIASDKFPQDHPWLLALIAGERYPPKNIEHLILQQLWDAKGEATEEVQSSLFGLPIIPPRVVYFLFYFRDIFPAAKKTLELIFSRTKKIIDLDLRFYKQLLIVYPKLVSEGLSPFLMALMVPTRTDLHRETLWSNEDVGRLIFSCIEQKKSYTHWVNELMDIDDESKQLLIKPACKSSIEFLNRVITVLWDNEEKGQYQPARDLFKSAPATSLQKLMRDKKQPVLVITGIYNRGFDLDDSMLYLLANHDGYILSERQVDDFLTRYRGSRQGLETILKFEKESFEHVSFGTWVAGTWFMIDTLLKWGAEIIKHNGYTMTDNDDVLIKYNRLHWVSLINRHFDSANSSYHKMLMDEVGRLYRN
jgi:hypothetical protein